MALRENRNQISKCAIELLLPFLSSYLAECRFSVINELILKKKSARYNITGTFETDVI